MPKLLVCSDNLLIKNYKLRKSVCSMLNSYVQKGNRFLLTSRKPLEHLSEVKLPGYGYSQIPAFLETGGFGYTDVSCLDGLFLYDNEGNLINYDRLDDKTIKIIMDYIRYLENVWAYKKISIKSYIVTPDGKPYDNIGNTIAGSVGIAINSKDISKISEKIRKFASKIDNGSCGLMLKSLGRCGDIREYDVRPIKSCERIQKNFLKAKYEISSSDVLDVDLALLDGEDVKRKLLDFMKP